MIQSEMETPWQVLAATIMMNRVRGSVAHSVIRKIIKRYPTPEAMMEANSVILELRLKKLGFQKRRARSLMSMSSKFVSQSKTGRVDLNSLPGVGPYAKQVWKVLVDKDFRVKTNDPSLKAYLKKARRKR